MSEKLAYCGLTCQTCPIYLAARQENSEERMRMKAEIVKLCNEHYGVQYSPEDITDCDGCTAEGGRLFASSRNCQIRKCAREKQLENCAHCPDYGCEKLEAFLKTEADAKARLDAIRKAIL